MVARLSDVRGQDRAVALLGRYLGTGSVPPGLLFHGEEGIGKEKAAGAFIAALLCRRRGKDGACGECPDCRLVEAGSHPNVRRVVPPPEKTSILIESIRELREELALAAFADRPRAALVVPADRMTTEAANALLKTLEEPPRGAHIVLVAHRLSPLPPTIVSRCQKVPFAPLDPRVVEAVLLSLPDVRGTHPEEAVRAAAAGSGGSPGRALSVLGEAEQERASWIALLSSADPAAALSEAASWRGASGTPARLAVPLALVRDLALLSSGGTAGIMNADRMDALARLAPRRSPQRWIRALRALLAMSRMPPQVQKQLLMEAFLLGR